MIVITRTNNQPSITMKNYLLLLGFPILFSACYICEEPLPPLPENYHIKAEAAITHHENTNTKSITAQVFIQGGSTNNLYPIYGGDILFYGDTLTYSSTDQQYSYTGNPPYLYVDNNWTFLGAPQVSTFEQEVYFPSVADHVYKATVLKKNRPLEVRCEGFNPSDSITYSVWLDSVLLSTVTKDSKELTHKFPTTVFDSVRVGSQVNLRISTSRSHYRLLSSREEKWAVFKTSSIYSELIPVDF